MYAGIGGNRKKWGVQRQTPCTWIAILTEEVGEASKEALDYQCENPVKGFDGKYKECTFQDQLDRINRLETELIQTAAVAVQILENIEEFRINNASKFKL